MRTRQVVPLFGVAMMLAFVSTQSDGTGAIAESARSGVTPDLRRLDNSPVQVNTAAPAESTIPLVVDGARNPELVPDTVAYRHFVMAASIPNRPSKEELARRSGLIRSVGLADHDAKAFIGALGGVRDELNRLDQERRDQGDALRDASLRGIFKARRDNVLLGAQARLLASLSPDGHGAVDKYVREHVKTQIKIYGSVAE